VVAQQRDTVTVDCAGARLQLPRDIASRVFVVPA
jgi:hypothetical protein